MVVNMITPRKVSLVVLIVFLAGCAAGGPGTGEKGYVHNYQLDEGMEISFETVADMVMEMDMPQMPIEGPIEATMSTVMKFEVEEVTEEKVKGALVIEDFDIEGMGGMLDQAGAGAALDQVKGTRIPVSMDKRGKSDIPELPEGLEEMDFVGGLGGSGFSGGLSSYFIPWPAGPVQPGFSWADTMSMNQAMTGVDVDVLMVTEYTYLGLQGEEGVEDSPLFHKVHSVMSMTMGVGADVEDANMIISGSSSGETDLYFSTEDGILDKAVGDMRISMLMEMIMPTMEMTIPMETSFASVIRRLP